MNKAYVEHLYLQEATHGLLREHEIRYGYACSLLRDSVILHTGCRAGSNLLGWLGAYFVIAVDASNQTVQEDHACYRQDNIEFVVLNSYDLKLRDHSNLLRSHRARRESLSLKGV